MTAKLREYKIIDIGGDLRISGSRASVYNVLESRNNGRNLYEIAEIHNLSPMQVETAFAYIDEHNDRLQAELVKIIERTEEGIRETKALMERVRAEIQSQPMSPERRAFYERRDQWIRAIKGEHHNGNGSE